MKYLLVSVIAGCLLLVSCHDEEIFNDGHILEFDGETFNNQRKMWQEQRLENYQFTQQLWQSIPWDEVTITVQGNAKKEVTFTGVEGNGFVLADTIDDIYSVIEKDFEADKKLLDKGKLLYLIC